VTEQPHIPPPVDPALRAAVREVEAHAAAAGWDQPAQLYALVPTAELIAAEPGLAAQLGLDEVDDAGSFTPIEQEVPLDRALEEVLQGISWPATVVGCVAVVERLVLPPAAEAALPEDAQGALDVAASHPDRQEVRMAVAVTRDGRSHCALRLRAYEGEADVLDGPDLVPTLVALLFETLTD
jgi:hypothetical protein